ncbi:MAG: hypothetical protein KGJ13_10395 [Patescibacteria group bacterium]|nr:hypothetical protein [Patescibacteria group bacterium]
MSYTSLAETTRTARKPHDCIWWLEPIMPGEKYLDRRGVFDGELQADHWHPECSEAQLRQYREDQEPEFDPHTHKRGSTEEADHEDYAAYRKRNAEYSACNLAGIR